MIPLTLPASSDALQPFVTKLGDAECALPGSSRLWRTDSVRSLWAGDHGLLEVRHETEVILDDVVLVDPQRGQVERLIRSGSRHNTLLITEQCDQLCVMCSQPPKKSHIDRFEFFAEACLLADRGQTIGMSGGEPTLHMESLLSLIERVGTKRPDLGFHILSNGQHFGPDHVRRLRNPVFSNVAWGIPLYSSNPVSHDQIVGKPGAFERLLDSFCHLAKAGARLELRTVLMNENVSELPRLAAFIARNLPFIEQWSIMDLENAGFARKRFDELRFDVLKDFRNVGAALDIATIFDICAKLFNFPLCFVPRAYRRFAVASISDWKQRFPSACGGCSAKQDCSGFFEWQPEGLLEKVRPI